MHTVIIAVHFVLINYFIFYHPLPNTIFFIVLDNASSYSFVLGSGECDEQFCNYALEADTEYTIKVRGFTSNAYRDSDILTFTTGEFQYITNSSITDS